jgi:hypothetical protein
VAPTGGVDEETAEAAGHGAAAMVPVVDLLASADRTEASPPLAAPTRTWATVGVEVVVDPTSAVAAAKDTRRKPGVYRPAWMGWIADA